MASTPFLLPAAQYLRMSTEHQQYSLPNQSSAIQQYAQTHGFYVAQTYADPARSGLVLKNRSGLRQLLHDVVNRPAYKIILVYDVSRWGRFQDTDEAAHYEFICRSAGIPVHYCAESFPNDGSMPALIMKALKRMMASEYSRELSTKVYEGSKRIAQLGFRVGGVAGYGLRRMLVSKDGQHKQELAHGEGKNIKDDRVILVPGPEEEANCIREIFRMYVEEEKQPLAIAEELNRKGVRFVGLRRTAWYSTAVSRVLSNMKYAGDSVYGKRSQRLRTPNITMPKDRWIVTRQAWKPIIDQETFDKAQRRTQNQTFFKSDEQLLADLRELLKLKGKLSEQIINETPGYPTIQAYRRRFGSFSEALARIEYKEARVGRTLSRRKRAAMRDELIQQILTAANNDVSVIRPNRQYRPELRLPDRTLVSVYLCPSFTIGTGEPRWLLDRAHRAPNHITLLARLKAGNDELQDLYVIPKSRSRTRWTIKLNDEWLNKGEKLSSVADFSCAVQAIKKRPFAGS
jgi:DNA invertase Pin-like site-specific DNA recombinase